MNIKVGDRVKLVNHGYHAILPIGTVLSINSSTNICGIICRYKDSQNEQILYFFKDEIKSLKHYDTPLGRILYK